MSRFITEAPFDRERERLRLEKSKTKICRWCGGVLEGRRTAWCSERCKEEFWIRSSGSYARSVVAKRDKGICAVCGLDTRAFRRKFVIVARLSHHRTDWDGQHKQHCIDWASFTLSRWLNEGWDSSSPYRSCWELDHIQEVVNGGGACGLDNLQTLCVPCHKKKTARLRRELAKKRRAERGVYTQQRLFE